MITENPYSGIFYAVRSLHNDAALDTGRKLNVHKMFRRRPGLLNVLCAFSLCPVSTRADLQKKSQLALDTRLNPCFMLFIALFVTDYLTPALCKP